MKVMNICTLKANIISDPRHNGGIVPRPPLSNDTPHTMNTDSNGNGGIVPPWLQKQ